MAIRRRPRSRWRGKVFGRPARQSVPCSVSPLEPAGDLGAQREQLVDVDAGLDAHAGEHEGQVFARRVAARAGRVRAAADAGEASRRSGRRRSRARRRRWRARGRACRGSGRTRSARRRSARACSNRSRTARRVGVADGVGDADAVGAGVEQRLHAAQHFARCDLALDACSRRRCRCRLRSASSSRPRRARRGSAPTSATTSSGVLRRLARLCAWLADSGTSSRSASASMARSAPLQVGHQHRDEQARQRLRVGHQLGGVGELRQQARRHERADLDLALAGGVGVADPLDLALGRQDRRDALQAVAQADFADHDAGGEAAACACLRSGAPVWCRRMDAHFRHSAEHHPVVLWNASHSGSETSKPAHHRGHARHRPQDAAPARRGLRPPQHGARRRAGAHRAVGDQQAHRPARGATSARRC